MDYLIKALALDDQARVYLVKSKETLTEAIRRHDLWPTAASVLGKTMSMGLMMGSMLKNDCALTIKINGNGPIGNIVVDATSNGEVRGYVHQPHINFTNTKGLADSFAIGDEGFLDVIKDLKMKDLFTSTIAITGDLAKDFTYYFMESDQTPSAVYLGTLIDVNNLPLVNGGMIIQLLPNTTEETITSLEEILSSITSVSTLFELHSLEEILELLFKSNYRIVETKDVLFHCGCSKETFSKALITLGVKELTDMYNEEEKIEATCHYCNEHYHFEKDEILELIKEVKNNE